MSWGREWESLSEHMQEAVLRDRTTLIEAYIGALTGANTSGAPNETSEGA